MKRKTNIFFICGPHCSGKTSIITRLIEDGIISFGGTEIGKDFYYARKNEGFDTEKVGFDFEFEVTNAEIARDEMIYKNKGIAVLETWHPGNLAYIIKRNPSIGKDIVKHIQKCSPLLNIKDSIMGIRLDTAWDSIYKRTKTFSDNRNWAADFYTEISKKISYAISIFGLSQVTFPVDANGSFENTYQKVSEIIYKYGA